VKRRGLVVVVALVAALATPVQATSQDTADPQIAAAAWYLVGADGTVLAQESSRRERPIASITKLMTALVALEHARPSDVVQVTAEAASVGGSTMYLRAGEQLTVAELVRGLLVPSANDAAMALALHVGEGSTSRFVELMNDKARELDLTDTAFRNPHGLDEAGHVSSARDATLLLRHAFGIPFVADALTRSSVFSGGRRIPTTDDLLGSWGPFDGGKTGHTDGAGWSEAGAATARGATVYGTVLGTGSRTARNDALQTLLEHGLDSYRRVAAIDSSRVYATAETGYGLAPVELVPERTIVRTVHARAPLLERVVAPVSVGLPVAEGERLGRVEIWRGDDLVASTGLVAADAVTEPGLVRKSAWFVERTGEHLWGLLT
jgi:serine-type D-Ala-D-Ala carboxypeptidase (penicillin-binding protein 5/6)